MIHGKSYQRGGEVTVSEASLAGELCSVAASGDIWN